MSELLWRLYWRLQSAMSPTMQQRPDQSPDRVLTNSVHDWTHITASHVVILRMLMLYRAKDLRPTLHSMISSL